MKTITIETFIQVPCDVHISFPAYRKDKDGVIYQTIQWIKAKQLSA